MRSVPLVQILPTESDLDGRIERTIRTRFTATDCQIIISEQNSFGAPDVKIVITDHETPILLSNPSEPLICGRCVPGKLPSIQFVSVGPESRWAFGEVVYKCLEEKLRRDETF